MNILLKSVYFFILLSSVPHVLSSYNDVKAITIKNMKKELEKIQNIVEIDLSKHIDIVEYNIKYFEINVEEEHEYAMYSIDRSLDEALKKIRKIVEFAMEQGIVVAECIEDVEDYFSKLKDLSSAEVGRCFKTVPEIIKPLCDNQFWEVRNEMEDTIETMKRNITKCFMMCPNSMLTQMSKKKNYLLDVISNKTEYVLGSIVDLEAVRELCPLDEYLKIIKKKITNVIRCLESQ